MNRTIQGTYAAILCGIAPSMLATTGPTSEKQSRRIKPARIELWLIAVLTICLSPGVVSAGSPDLGVEVYAQDWRPDLPVPDDMRRVFSQPRLVSDKLTEAVNANSSEICESIKQRVTVPNLVGDGITIKARKFKCTLGDVTKLKVINGIQDFILDFVLKGNRFDVETTQPTVAGSYADPAYTIPIDVQVLLYFKWDASGKLTLTKAEQNVVNNVVPPIATNAAGALAFMLDMMAGFAKSRQFESTIVDAVNNSGGLSSRLRAMFDSVQMPAPPVIGNISYRLVQVIGVGNKLKFGFKVVLGSNPNLSGTLGGAVRWPATLRAENYCGSFKVTAKAQYLPREFRGFDKPMGSPQMIEQEAFFDLAVHDLPDGRHECRYRISNLPGGHSTEVKAAPPRLVDDAHAQSQHTGAGARYNVPLLAAAGWTSPLVAMGQTNIDFQATVQTIPGVKALVRPQTLLDQKNDPSKGVRVPVQPGSAPQPPHGPTDRVPLQPTSPVEAKSQSQLKETNKALVRPEAAQAPTGSSVQRLNNVPSTVEQTLIK
jgi:hypothetical protein